jgi:UDP-N-acetyl-D-galactosamine dehydrogenase
VQDIRNSKVVDMYNELRSFMVNVEVVDPHAVDEEVHEEYGVHLAPEIGKDYDAIIVAVPHEEYKNLDESWFQSRMRAPGLLIDLKGLYRKDIKQLKYWSL